MLSTKSQLFVEIVEEEQEVVSGGQNPLLINAQLALFDGSSIGATGTGVAGFGGSGALGTITAVDVNAAALNLNLFQG